MISDGCHMTGHKDPGLKAARERSFIKFDRWKQSESYPSSLYVELLEEEAGLGPVAGAQLGVNFADIVFDRSFA
jgi:hypothetical protein